VIVRAFALDFFGMKMSSFPSKEKKKKKKKKKNRKKENPLRQQGSLLLLKNSYIESRVMLICYLKTHI
jgi:CRISPR/Cas system-associated protein Cas5 (RAMP superfamily)